MFEYNTVVGYSKLDKNKQVPLYEIMNYMQDCTTFHSEALDRGLEYMESVGKAWVLKAYQINKVNPLKLGQKITVGTSPTDFKGTLGERQFYIKDENGNFLVKANSLWVLIDLSLRRPIRITEEDQKAYTLETVFDDVNVERKMNLSPEKEEKEAFKVYGTYIDSNGHMNNADYLRVAEELLPSDFQWSSARIIYNKEAMEGEVMIPFMHQESEGIGISFENDKGEILTKIKIH